MRTKDRTDCLKTPVQMIMSRDVTCLAYDDTVRQALETASEENLAAFPVVDESGKCVGVLSRSDLSELFVELDECVERLSGESTRYVADLPDGFRTKVSEFMSPKAITIELEQTVVEAASLMSKNHIHHLPVVDNAGAIRGIVSTLDIARWVSECFTE
ncbi:MAG TPA: CBS domain-containing protein [Pirellulaceae bacterium]|nr:CBS domain-containing protein [Pirellulaceae bacterium]HMO92267.1 CBS domain-containing protein [Pirellulaceae bacterium]HMP70084.1 CBS domain-containing protein [Pirellulaceae bacterium]